MTFKNIDEIKEAGFVGFKTISELIADDSIISNTKGVYFILYLEQTLPTFSDIGTGGYFKGRNPNVSIEKLKSNWIEDTIVVYIGKGGGLNQKRIEGKETLRSRLKSYFSFGRGNRAGHSGGKYIWQLQNSNELVVCWLPTPKDEPAIIESNFINEFKVQYNNQRPFANHRD